MSNLHDRQAAVDLIKAAIAPEQGSPLFNLQKGDVPGHAFHGNQYGEGGSGSVADKIRAASPIKGNGDLHGSHTRFTIAAHWANEAEARGLKVREATHPTGRSIPYFTAKDTQGNHRGQFAGEVK